VTTPVFDHRMVAAFLALPADVDVSPGPPSYEGVADTVGKAVVLTVGGGPGLNTQQLFDGVFVTVDIAGDQNDPDSANDLARLVDQQILSLHYTQTIGGVRVLYATRAGGRPTPVSVDDGDRWHLACSYVWQVQSDA
jgi:hypothetical protein